MYVNQIDNIIDNVLDQFYLGAILNDDTTKNFIRGKKKDFVEAFDKINLLIKKYIEGIDTTPIQKLINSKENTQKIINIIKRYVAYYYFLYLGYYYDGTIKDFRNNIIQFSKLQEKSTYLINNFFDTENNYQLIKYFKLTRQVSKIIMMTDLQQKTIDRIEMKDAIDFLNNLGKDYIDNFLLEIKEESSGTVVEINSHNLIKTIVFGEIYQNQEQSLVFSILNEIQEGESQYTYIDVVVTTEEYIDYASLTKLFDNYDNADTMSLNLYDMIVDMNKPITTMSPDAKNNKLLSMPPIIPIIDDFLRYHRDSERIETDPQQFVQIPSADHSKNIQNALLYKKKKKENTKAQIIINKIDMISELYSEVPRKDPELFKKIKQQFYGPLSHRKVVLYNYLEELYVLNKMLKQGKQSVETTDYYLELLNIISKSYFNFKNFNNQGTSLNVNLENCINVIRQSTIENITQSQKQIIESRTIAGDSSINLVGLCFNLIKDKKIQCVTKEELINIRDFTFNYTKGKTTKKYQTQNGFKMFSRLIKYVFVKTIQYNNLTQKFVQNMDEIARLNPDIFTKIIYWNYDTEKDVYATETYESIKVYNFRDTIKYMNSIIYDKYIDLLKTQLKEIIVSGHSLNYEQIDDLIVKLEHSHHLNMTPNERNELMYDYFSHKKIESETKISSQIEKRTPPEYIPNPEPPIYLMKIDMTNPMKLKEPKSYAITGDSEDATKINKHRSNCEHVDKLSLINKYKRTDPDKYSMGLMHLVKDYSIDSDGQKICKICGEVLPIREYTADGKFDNKSEKFVVSYYPIDIPLKDLREYKKLSVSIDRIGSILKHLSLVSKTNILTGTSQVMVMRRNGIIKTIIDIIIKHNKNYLFKKQKELEKYNMYSRKFNIDPDMSNLIYFELNDDIFDLKLNMDQSGSLEINRLKLNNVLLYTMLLFILELNGPQIVMMFANSTANIYTYLKYGDKLFTNLLIKKSSTDSETVPITKFPILCYLLFVFSYFLLTYNMWYYPGEVKTNKYNPVLSKLIIHSAVDLINTISLEAGLRPDDYTYVLISSKFYTQCNGTFRDPDVLNLLKSQQQHYEKIQPVANVETKKIQYYNIDTTIKNIESRPRMTYKAYDGLFFENYKIAFQEIRSTGNFDTTNCPTGDYHNWQVKGKDMVCTKCETLFSKLDTSKPDTLTDKVYYFNLAKIANKKCITGLTHLFEVKNNIRICSRCGKKTNDSYSLSELDQLQKNLDKIETDNIQKNIMEQETNDQEINRKDTEYKKIYELFTQNYQKSMSGSTNMGDFIMDKISSFIDKLEVLVGENVDLGIDKFPYYLKYDVYVIDHLYTGSPLENPIIISEVENIMLPKQKHTFFKCDVLYYMDHRNGQVEVYYDATTLNLIGYREKNKDYKKIETSNKTLIRNRSIKNQLWLFGFESSYLKIDNTKQNILETIAQINIRNRKAIIDKFSVFINRVSNGYSDTNESTDFGLQSTQTINKIMEKYYKTLNGLKIQNDKFVSFDEWPSIKHLFGYQDVDWEKISQIIENNMIHADIIIYNNTTTAMLTYYLLYQLELIMNINAQNKTTQISIAQMYIDVINYIFHIYNQDNIKYQSDIKRFNYVMNAGEYTIDLLRKGQGIETATVEPEDLGEETELSKDEMKEIKELNEEADARDVEGEEWEGEDEGTGEMESEGGVDF